MKKVVLTLICSVALLMGGTQAANAFIAVDLVPTQDFTNGAWSLGFEFTVNSDIDVTHLGFYDSRRDGLTERHDVGIFDVGTTALLGSATVTGADPLTGYFRYTTLGSVIELDVGETYRIAASTGSEQYTFDPFSSFSTDPNVNYVRDVFLASGSLVYPTQSEGGNRVGWFGPNFQFVLAGDDGQNGGDPKIPEPGSLALLGTGLIGLLRKRRMIG